jgi:hypothetical protein
MSGIYGIINNAIDTGSESQKLLRKLWDSNAYFGINTSLFISKYSLNYIKRMSLNSEKELIKEIKAGVLN